METQEFRCLILIAVLVVLLVIPCGCAPTSAPAAVGARPTPEATRPTETVAPTMTPTGTPTLTSTPLPTFTSRPTDTSTPAPTQTTKPSLTPTESPTPRTAPVSRPSSLVLIGIQKYDYSEWGRPEGMDTPGKPCGNFNDKRPVRRLTASLRVENRSGQDMKEWGPRFYKANGDRAYTCYMGYQGVFPTIPAGQARDVTFTVFMEREERISYGDVVDKALGGSNQLAFP